MPNDHTPNDAFGLIRSYLRHRMFVTRALGAVAANLRERAEVHDASKMLDDEFTGFARINAAARVHKFGSPGYQEGLNSERPTIDLHFSRNPHHPEHHDQSFLDIIEMVCDWWGARAGYDDHRSWSDTVKINIEKKGQMLSEQHMWLVREVAEYLGTIPTRPDGAPDV